MADHNTIADATWNPVRDNRPAPEVLGQPWHWVKPRRISVGGKPDLFHESVPFEYIAAVFWVMSVTTRHTYQVLTKRPARMLEFFRWLLKRQDMDIFPVTHPAAGYWMDNQVGDIGHENPFLKALGWTPATSTRGGYDNCGPLWPYENVWLGVSVENQETADERIPLLLQCPAAVRWISAEPLLGPLDLGWFLSTNVWENGVAVRGSDYGHGVRLDWVVTGGESGPAARPMHPDWARSLRDQCAAAGVPFFFKQNGEYVSVSEVAGPGEHFEFPDGATVRRVGKKLAGRLLDGVEHNAHPESTR